jgi:hemolysin III
MLSTTPQASPRDNWWHRRRPFSRAELIADGVVHGVGLVVAVALGSILLAFAAHETAQRELPALVLYLSTLVTVLGVSLAFNLWPLTPAKKLLARLDQAAIFLLIAGTYTPFLAIIGGTPTGTWMTAVIWGGALVGVALKLIVPQHFGRLAILLYLGIGWSGVLVFQTLAAALPPTTLWLVVAGGLAYTGGIVFHLWDRLSFQNVLWHVFVVAGASLHLLAILDCMVLSRL